MRKLNVLLAGSLALLVSALLATTSLAVTPTEGDLDKIPKPAFRVDPALKPLQKPDKLLPGQVIGSISDTKGNQADFWVNQLVVLAKTDAEAKAIASRWNGKVDRRFMPQERGVGLIPGVFVLTINPAKARSDLLPQFVRTLHPLSRGAHRFSSAAAQLTAAAAAQEAANGHAVELNWLMVNHDFASRLSIEAPTLPDPNAFNWSYLRSGGAQDSGVADAWRVLEYFGRLGNTVAVSIFDSGFRSSPDLPAGSLITPVGMANRAGPGTCDGSPCPFHGTAVAAAGFAVPDNGFGVAGPGGPVARLTLVASPGIIDFSRVFEYLASLVDATNSADIISLSFGVRIPAAAALLGVDAVAATVGRLREVGKLVIASAGNGNWDIDGEDCFILCWEEAMYLPCEIDGVLCVGGLETGSLQRANGSNFGSNPRDCCTVKIWGPFTVNTADTSTGDLINPGAHSGTSYSAPFVAGVAALVKAANPQLGPDDIRRVLLTAGHWRPAGDGPAVYAYGAVLQAMGLDNGPPALSLKVLFPAAQTSLNPHDPLIASVRVFDVEDGAAIANQVQWTLDGHFLAHRGGTLNLPNPGAGAHTLSAKVADTGLLTAQDRVTFEVVDHPPRMTIISPTRPAAGQAVEWSIGSTLQLRGQSSDIDEPGGSLADQQVEWSLESTSNLRPPLPLGHGHQLLTGLPATLTAGDYHLVFKGRDAANIATDRLLVHVRGAGQTPPTITFQAPAEGSRLRATRVAADDTSFGRPYGIARVRLHALATDLQDGEVSARIIWLDAAGREIGRGTPVFANFPTAALYGTYGQSVRARVSDADNQTTETTLHFGVIWDGTLALPPCEQLNQHNCIP